MTFAEMIIAVLLVGAAVFLLVGWMETIRRDAKMELARSMLAKLDTALARYHRANECYPPVRGTDSALDAVVQLINHERTREIIESLPESVRRGPGNRMLVDPWGTPLRYLPEGDPSEYVRANEGRPLFVSAGPDRDFGDHDKSCLGDNLRSDDPGDDGFRNLLAPREGGGDK